MKSDLLPIVLIIIILAIVGGGIFYFYSWTSDFNQGDVFFQIPGGWSQNQAVGDFNNTVFSQVVYTQQIQNESGTAQEAFIIVQMQKISGTGFNATSLQVSILNSSNSSVSNLKVNNYNVMQYTRNSPAVANKIATIDNGNFMYIVEYVCPPSVANQTEEAYNQVLKTLKINS
jgi:hypothetical protein